MEEEALSGLTPRLQSPCCLLSQLGLTSSLGTKESQGIGEGGSFFLCVLFLKHKNGLRPKTFFPSSSSKR